jgi:hypothetical protein
METKEGNKTTGKPYIIANPIYDTVFKRLMENQRIAKFFLSTILEQQIEEITVLPKKFTYKLDPTKISKEEKEKKGKKNTDEYYFMLSLDFMATVLTDKGDRRKILIELRKPWYVPEVIRFRKSFEQYVRKEAIDGKTILPIKAIYILGNNLAEIDCPFIKGGHTYIDMINKKPIDTKSKFMECLTPDSYVIQARRITDVRYTTNLDKLLSIFEQKYFVERNSDTRKEYYYNPTNDEEDMMLITDILYETGSDPKKRKLVEDEKALRIINNVMEPLRQAIEKQEKLLEKIDKAFKGPTKLTNKQAKAFKEEIAEVKRFIWEEFRIE